ncbi:MAG TPA: immunoglobulin-like domain-containing protein, partial [Pyrinomonadaceae bacterium]|nr:immunoglobulin-like domain-containing protein [Pyrinomonadaceae bacterium]
MSYPPFVTNPLSKLKYNSTFAAARRSRLNAATAGATTARRAGALLALFAIITAAVGYAGLSPVAAAAAASPADKASATVSLQPVALWPEANSGARAWLIAPAWFQLFPVDTLNTYAADCATPKRDFDLGETVCARTSIPSSFFFFHRLTWIDPNNHVLDTASFNASEQTNVFTLPGTPTSFIDGNTVDNRGTWRVDLRTADGSRSATVSFDVHEPANPRADLQIAVGGGDRVVDSGATVTVKVSVYNAGPDAATDVQVSALSISGLSLQSFSAAVGGDCGAGGACALATLPRGAHALFFATYSVTARGGAEATAEATVAADTQDPRPRSNSDTVAFTVSQTSGETQTCTLTPPPPISVNGSEIPDPNDPSETLYGAFVTYAVDAEGDSCSPVQCDVPSGSLFPAGTTLVTCTAASGDSATFPVTVSDTRAFTINLIGANPLRVDCNTTPPFADPGATTNRVGVTPTAVSTVDPNTPGAYTITYTATDGANTVTATRSVNVVDDSPPTVTLSGDNPRTDEVETQEMTIECHTGFTDPGATANDACKGDLTSQIQVSGTVDPNTVGSYTITYTAADDHGTPGDASDDLVGSVTRTIHVVDTTAPTITLTGGNVLTAECHGAFTD